MCALQAGTRLVLNNLLFLTDFSETSELAVPFAVCLAREYAAKLHALHVLTPAVCAFASPESAAATIESLEDGAQAEMQRLDSQLAGVNHETTIVRAESVWSGLQQLSAHRAIDLLVVGTHGRTGAMKLLLGSVAEEIFRRASVPVLTIGPSVRNGAHSRGRFHRVLYTTDFTSQAQAAAPYAISMAQENQARLVLLHVMRDPSERNVEQKAKDSVANVMHQLYEIVPQSAEIWCRPEATVRFGPPADRILEAAKELEADLIILGVRDPGKRIGAATHLEGTIAHKIVAHAACPVLTIRG
jgi:nucleotide-binding universal stress UspA family protein